MSSYYGIDCVSLHRLLVAFNVLIRYIYELGQRDHVSERVMEVLGYNSIPNYLKIRNLRFVHRILISGSPTYLKELFTLGPSPRSRSLKYPWHQTALRSFAVTAPRLWNSIPCPKTTTYRCPLFFFFFFFFF